MSSTVSLGRWAYSPPRRSPVSLYAPIRDRVEQPAAQPGIRVEVVGDKPQWLEPVALRLNDLLRLDKNWDSYGAYPVDRSTVVQVLRLLRQIMRADTPLPFLVPTAIGGICMEWHRDDTELVLRVDPDQEVIASLSVGDDENEWYVNSGSSMGTFTQSLRRLTTV
jgi:hypothetical protein